MVAAAFHPEQQGVFILAYADGSIAVYDALHILKRNGRARDSSSVPAGSAGEIASIKGLHTPTTAINTEGGFMSDNYDPGTGKVCVTANASGTTSVALLPGHKATSVTVGADGKCCVVDFTQPSKKRAVLLKSWHLRRPATSVSVIYARDKAKNDQTGAADDWNILSNKDYFVAVGRQDGKVLLFDLDGKLLGQKVLDARRTRIIDVEWAKLEPGFQVPEKEAHVSANTDNTDMEGKKLEIAAIRRLRRRAITPPIERDSLFDFTTPRRSLGLTPSAGTSHAAENLMANKEANIKQGVTSDISGPSGLALNSLNPLPDRSSMSPRLPALPQRESAEIQKEPPTRNRTEDSPPRSIGSGSTLQWGTTTSLSRHASHTPPPVPPRPTLKAGGRSYMRRAQRACEIDTHRVERAVSSGTRRTSDGSSRSHRRVSTTVLPWTKVLMGPRPLRKGSNTPSLQAKVASKQTSDPLRLSTNALSSVPNGANSSTKSSIHSYKTASSRVRSSLESEASNDTIVDWSPGIFRQPLPTPVDHPLVRSTPQKLRAKTKIDKQIKGAMSRFHQRRPRLEILYVIGPSTSLHRLRMPRPAS